MTKDVQRSSRKYYYCFSGHNASRDPNCGLKYIRIPVLDDFVWSKVVDEYMDSDLLQQKIDSETERLGDVKTTLEKSLKHQKNTLSTLDKQRNEITSLFISGKHSKEFLNKEMDKVVQKIDIAKKKYKELKEQLDKSQTDISLIDELFFFNSILSEPSNITEGTEKRELIEKMVDKIIMDHDGTNYLITIHFKYGIGVITYKTGVATIITKTFTWDAADDVLTITAS